MKNEYQEFKYSAKEEQYHAAQGVAALPEGKKFFLAPSLTTGTSGTSTGKGFSRYHYERVGSSPIWSYELRYETPSTLLLRGILKRDNPEHAAILDSFPETRRQEASGANEPRHPDVKPEVVDLVGLRRPRQEKLAPGEKLVCDLTADEEEPQWKKMKGNVEEVRLND